MTRLKRKGQAGIIGAVVAIVAFIIAITVGMYLITQIESTFDLSLVEGGSGSAPGLGVSNSTLDALNSTFRTGYNSLRLAGIASIVLGAAVIIGIIMRMAQ